tara:strand:+ start:1443 stop:1859 length:417 start_codon:yes stop_codon:yes gene_type:complete
MKISGKHLDVESLENIGINVARLLCAGDIKTVAQKFGYALSYNRDIASAIGEDLSRELKKVGSSALNAAGRPLAISVRYFDSNESNLFALIEVRIQTSDFASILVELIVSTKERDTYVTLEDISAIGTFNEICGQPDN